MSVFKKSFCALAALLLALPTLAQWPSTPALTFVRVKGGEKVSGPVCYADETPLLKGDYISPLYVLSADQLTEDSDLPFTVSSDGTVTPVNPETTRLVWASVGSSAPEAQFKLPMDKGLPTEGWGAAGTVSDVTYEQVQMSCSWPTDAVGGQLVPSTYCSLYLLAFDTRTSDAAGAVSAGGKQVYAWSATFVNSSMSMPTGLSSVYALNVPEDKRSELVGLFPSLPMAPTRFVDTTSASSQEVELAIPCGEVSVDGQPATSVEAAEVALTPGVASMAQNGPSEDFPNGSLSLGLTPPAAPGLTAYELWTATELDGTWQPFATVVAQEKGLASDGEMRYSRLRIEEKESLEIPLFEGDLTRFYRLRALGSVTESGE